MDKKKIELFFDFIQKPDKIELRLEEFSIDLNLRQEIWDIDKLELFLNRKQVNDFLLNLSWKLSLRAINEKNKIYINYAMILLAVENFTIDYRDSLIRLSIINHACDRLKVDFDDFINSAKEYSSEKAVIYYSDYLRKSPRKKGALYSMGLCEVVKNGKIHIEFKPPMQMIR